MKLKARGIDYSITFAEQTEFENEVDEMSYYSQEHSRVADEVNEIIDVNNEKLTKLNKEIEDLAKESKAIYNLAVRVQKKLGEQRKDALSRQMNRNMKNAFKGKGK